MVENCIALFMAFLTDQIPLQMGYVILFSAAYPQAAVWAFLNNLVEIRGDAFKLVNGVQRPFMKRVEDIGFWQEAFEVLSVISIMVNCALIGVRGQVGYRIVSSSEIILTCSRVNIIFPFRFQINL